MIGRVNKIRYFLLCNKVEPYEYYANKIGVDRKTLYNFVNGKHSTRIDHVEAFLNELGYTLTVEKLEGADDSN